MLRLAKRVEEESAYGSRNAQIQMDPLLTSSMRVRSICRERLSRKPGSSRNSISEKGMDWEEGLLVDDGWCIAKEKIAELKIWRDGE
jgi:hypothetical protein